MSGLPIVDAHHHVWDLTVRDQPWISGAALAPLRRSFCLDDLRPAAEAAGVTATVLVQTITVAEETPEFLALADGDPLVAGVVGWTDLTAPDVADALARLRELPGGDRLVGIRHQVQEEPDRNWLLRPDVRRGLLAVAGAGLVYDLVVKPHQLPAAIGAAAGLAGLTFVLDHLGKPPIASGELEPWADRVRRLAALPNTVAKFSGLLTEAAPGAGVDDLRPYVDVAMEAFGPHRLMFGSDWPVSTLAADYGQTVDATKELLRLARLSTSEQAAVLSGTATGVYGLGR
ncbi:L-fuconolactonase [Kitasatospora sp. GP30]|uniref:amidohydrolase family protein n=1 Tax=Kitasatospora sp. GP30 TaxID=3035084 RepID=UPI000C7019D1|nr:amidohydrolase family protein [Kitasatospora sp. GP30]MDH6143418.1 L-fuconolactonase [Kitasatospora sp. GP30]